jgi:alanyl-tRNA synthetase
LTERLYYKDSDLLEFDATVVQTGRSGVNWYVVLDRSAFYPTSGGQSHDTGRLNDLDIMDVIETDDGEVWHMVSQDPGPTGTAIHGVIDPERRRRNRQNHTAQHILSAVFHRLYGYRTMSVHLGDEYGAVELQTESLSEEQLGEIETAANQIIADNVSVDVRFVDSSEAEKLPLRKEPQREGKLRIIRIGEYDYSACGGTHCATSGGVRLIKILGAEKIRGRILVKYLAGNLAMSDYAHRFDITDELAKSMTCSYGDLPGKIGGLVAEAASLRRQLVEAQKELLPIKAHRLSQNPAACGRYKLVMDTPPGIDAATGSRLAGMVADEIGGLAALVVEERLILASAPGSGLHAGNLARQIAERTGLKGGGNERVAQIGGVKTDRVTMIQDTVRLVLEND